MVQDQYLTHMRRPDLQGERETSPSFQMDDFEALYLRRALRGYAHYHDDEEGDYDGIARAYVQYIDTRVRDNKQDIVDIYAHTGAAVEVLEDALDESNIQPPELREQIERYVAENLVSAAQPESRGSGDVQENL